MNKQNLQRLQHLLSQIDQLIQQTVTKAHAAGHNPADTLRGLVVSTDEVERHLDADPLTGLWAEDEQSLPGDKEGGPPDPSFQYLMNLFGLSVLDVYILLICVAPDLDRRYERLYAFLQDDITQRRPTLNLVMNLLGSSIEGRFAVWERLQPGMPLREHRLVNMAAPPDKPHIGLLSHICKSDTRIAAHLLGSNMPDDRIRPLIANVTGDETTTLPQHVIDTIAAAMTDNPLIYMRGERGFGQIAAAITLCSIHNLPLLIIDANQAGRINLTFDEVWRLVLREAYFNDATLLINEWEQFLDDNQQPERDFWQALYHYHRPVFICGATEWEPLDTHRTRRLLRIPFDLPEYEDRRRAWHEFTDAAGLQTDDEMLDVVSNKFRLTRDQIARAVTTAVDIAVSRGEAVSDDDLYAGVQAHTNLQLGHLAQRIKPVVDWSNLILPPEQLRQLYEITQRARFAHQVQDEWGFSITIRGSHGVSALFSGDSGTGKTLSAQVIANELGLPMYRVDLSAVVSKYIGETEKNLNTIFTEARSSNAILFFDEADAIFGKRSEVKDARDRYANIEVAYLLQKVEDYDGVAILATNMRQNLDEAFTRRLDFLIDFPFPDVPYRLKLWEVHFPAQAPLDPAIDLNDMAERYHLAGGNIRNAALAAAFLAAADGGIITPTHIHNAVRREHQKMGRLIDATAYQDGY